MKTFKEFLAEAEEYKSLEKLLLYECDEFISAGGAEYLIRAMQAPKGERHYAQNPYEEDGVIEYYVLTPRLDRKPKDTKLHTHKILDDWFNDQFGFRARSQGVFAFGQKANKGDIENYGKPYMFFARGPFEIIWSPKVQDLYADMLGSLDNADEEQIWEYLDDQGYQKSWLEKAVKSRNEVMVKCSSFIMIPFEFKDTIDKYLASL